MPELTFVVATKDRPAELARMWRSLNSQTRLPREVVIVDAGSGAVPDGKMSQARIPLRHVRSSVASATRQRNLGIGLADPKAELIGFLDDDIVLESTAVEEMLRFWEQAGARVGGAAFNMLNHPPLAWRSFKLNPMVAAAGLYACRPGAVSPAGFQSMIGRVETTEYADWLPSTASVWRREVFDGFRFDEWFQGYSYLEDLDFSYRVGKAYRLAVVATARYRHLPAQSGRGDGYAFGLREVRNRVYFVRKNPEMSLARCHAALSVRLLMSAALGFQEIKPYYFGRALGNIVGLAMSLGRMLPAPRNGAGARRA